MKLIENLKNIKYEYEINNKEDLIEVLKYYAASFLPENDDLAADIFKAGDYDELIDGLNYYYNEPFLSDARGIIGLFRDVSKMNTVDEIIMKINDFNKYTIEYLKFSITIEN